MTRGGRVAGGVLALIGSCLMIINILISYIASWATSNQDFIISMVVSIIIMALGVVGAILLLRDKTIGGIIVLIAAVALIIGSFILLPSGTELTKPLLKVIDPGLMIVGGALGVAIGTEI